MQFTLTGFGRLPASDAAIAFDLSNLRQDGDIFPHNLRRPVIGPQIALYVPAERSQYQWTWTKSKSSDAEPSWMHVSATSEQELLDLVSIWTFELLDNSISLENFFQLENTLLQSSTARDSFFNAMQMHRDLIGMFSDTPDYLVRGLRRAVELVEYIKAEAAEKGSAQT